MYPSQHVPWQRALTALVGLSLISSAIAQNAVSDFSLYPSDSRKCLTDAQAGAKCDDSSVPKFNACVCGNGGGFIERAVKCLQGSASGTLGTVYNTLNTNCGESKTPIPFNLQQFLALGASAQPTTARPTTTTVVVTGTTVITSGGQTAIATVMSTAVVTSAPSAPSAIVSTVTLGTGSAAQVTVVTFQPQDASSTSPADKTNTKDDDGKLSTTAIVGMGVGIPLFCALVGLIGVLLWRHRRKQNTTVPSNPPGPYVDPSPRPTPVTEPANPHNSQHFYGAQPHIKQDGYSPVPQYSTTDPYVQQHSPAPYHQQAYPQPAPYNPYPQAAGPYVAPPPQHGTVELGGHQLARPAELAS